MITTPHYAGFWRRFNAYGIDATFVALLAYALEYLLPGSSTAAAQTPDNMAQLTTLIAQAQSGQLDPATQEMLIQSLMNSMFGGSVMGPNTYLMIVISALYNILFVLGPWHATPGKRMLGMKVVHRDGTPLTFTQSIARHMLSGLSMLPLGLGCATIGFTREKTAPHDMICHTRVVRL